MEKRHIVMEKSWKFMIRFMWEPCTVIVCAGRAIWFNPFAMVLVCVECCVLYPCCMGVFGMFAVM